jgi:hypothetical protein
MTKAVARDIEGLRSELAGEVAKPVKERDYEKLHALWQALLRLERSGRTKGKRCCIVCRVDVRAADTRHADGCSVGAALTEVEHAVHECLAGRRIRLSKTPIKLSVGVVASLFDLDAAERKELAEWVERWEGLDDLDSVYAAIGVMPEILEAGLRARGRRQRAAARLRRRQLLAELVLVGAIAESKLPAPISPEAWRRLVTKGRIAQA